MTRAASVRRGTVPLAPPWSTVAVLLSAAVTAGLTVMVWHSHALPELDSWVLRRVASHGDATCGSPSTSQRD